MEDGALPLPQHILDHHHTVGPMGQRVAGVHHGKPAGGQGNRGGLGGPEGVRRLYRDAVHGAGGIVGGTQAGIDRPGSHPARRPGRGQAFRLGGKAPLRQPEGIVPLSLLQRQIGQIGKGHGIHLLRF